MRTLKSFHRTRVRAAIAVAALAAALLAPGAGAQLPQAEPVPGGIAVIALGPVHEPAPQVLFNRQRV
ncbi:MAG: hypothetical protein OEW21_14910, partial [Betaproteobacteria bacterium]|nr:hypothetical protein [Betaproteobacteria bacterium]